MTPDPSSIRRILVRANNWIGDVVMISPSLQALRETYPDARIEAMVRPWVAGCFEGHPDLDGVVLHDPRGRHRGMGGFRALTRELRERRYDMAVLFQKAFGAALLAWSAGIPVRVGYDTDRRALLLTNVIGETPALRRIHHVEYFLEVARAAGCNVNGVPRRVSFHLTEDARGFARKFLVEHDAARNPMIAAIAVGASKPGRAWHADRFAALARYLAVERGARVLVLGGKGDREASEPVLAAAGDAAIDGVGNTTVPQMAALLEHSRIFIGNDSGPMHVAAALNIPTLGIFGPGSLAKTAPYMPEDRFIALSENFHCSPCRQDFFRECAPGPSFKPMCLEMVEVPRARAALDELLART